MKSLLFAILLVFGGVRSYAQTRWLDQSQDIFLPKSLKSTATNFREFPIFWWNFIVLDRAAQKQIDIFCTQLSQQSRELGIQKLPCHFTADSDSEVEVAQAWIHDQALRRDYPTESELKARMDQNLAKASLPLGRDLVYFLRLDPLNAMQSYLNFVHSRINLTLPRHGGTFTDPTIDRTLLPLQLAFSPRESGRTEKLTETIATLSSQNRLPSKPHLFGPHAATLENEAQIHSDVERVSIIGALALGALCVFLFITGRGKILNLVPMLLLSVLVASVATILIFGSIHGLTLAFGPGIIGLAMDYGIHSCFLNPLSGITWRANWVGLLTSIVVFVILGFSAIPLLSQMMFFATFGICLSYLTFYLVMRRFPDYFSVASYAFEPRKLKAMEPLAAFLILASGLLVLLNVQLDLQHLNFESSFTKSTREWFYNVAGSKIPYFIKLRPNRRFGQALEHHTWAIDNNIDHLDVTDYLPPVTEQRAHLASWQKHLCSSLHFSVTHAAFFKPFLTLLNCASLRSQDLDATQSIPEYLKDLNANGNFVSLFFPRDQEQVQKLISHYREAHTPKDLFKAFPPILLNELFYMIPLGMLGALFFLWRHYRHLGWSLLAIVPFSTGAGCYALVTTLFHLPVSFISLIGLLMVFGCSLDYGVFVMDFLLYRKNENAAVWSTLSICALATMSGFAPLVFAQHPVLNDLGQVLLWGTFGTWIGALWGVRFAYSISQRSILQRSISPSSLVQRLRARL